MRKLFFLLTVVAAIALTGCGGERGGRAASGSLVYSQSAGLNPANAWVWRANVDGMHPVRVTKGFDPTISPNGKFVTFLRLRCASTPPGWTCPRAPKLFLSPTSGGTAKWIANTTIIPPALTWAPDSQRLAVEAKGGIDVFDLATGNGELIAKGNMASSPSFSPDSRFVVFQRDRRSPARGNRFNLASDLFVTDLATGKSRQITHLGDAGAPAWGPSEIAFGHNHEVWLTDRTGTRLRRLTDKKAVDNGWPSVWSANGRVLLLSNGPFRGKGTLGAVDVPSGRVSFVGAGIALGLSRDGKVALVDDCAYGIARAIGRVETVPLDGGKAHAVVPGDGNCWASWNN